jgi:hypothetical protein
MNEVENAQDQTRRALQQQLGNSSRLFDSIRSIASKYSSKEPDVILEHDRKNWYGRLVDWVKWKTPLAKYSCFEYRRLEYYTEYDVKAIYYDLLLKQGKYRIRHNKIYVRHYISNPYTTYLMTYTPASPVSYISIDFEVSNGR